MDNRQIMIVVVLIIVLLGVLGFLKFIEISQREGVFRSAALNSLHIAHIINMIQAAPDDTSHEYLLPNAKCKVEITENYVRFSFYDQNFQTRLLQTDIDVEEKIIECSEKEREKNRLCIRKSGGAVTIKELGCENRA